MIGAEVIVRVFRSLTLHIYVPRSWGGKNEVDGGLVVARVTEGWDVRLGL